MLVGVMLQVFGLLGGILSAPKSNVLVLVLSHLWGFGNVRGQLDHPISS